MAVLIYGAWRKVKRPFQGLSTFDMDQLGKISRHHEKVVKLLSLKVIRLKRGSHSSASYENLQTLDTWGASTQHFEVAVYKLRTNAGEIPKHTFQRHKRLTTGHPNVNRPPSVPSWETLLFFAAHNRHGTSPSFAHTIS